MCICVCISLCGYVHVHTGTCDIGTCESIGFAGTGVTSVVSHPSECWELNSDLPQEGYHGTVSPSPKTKSVSILEK